MSSRCICCGATGRTPLLQFLNVPISGIFLDDRAETLPRYDLKLTHCDGCGLATRDRQSLPDHDYSHIDRGTAQQMPDYAAAILASLRAAGLSPGDRVLEVGSNDGSFLSYLRGNGFTALSGIEPSRHLATLAEARGFDITVDYCTRQSATGLKAKHGPFKAIVCRHTLEHVPDPEDLLAAIGMLLEPGGLCLLEVPDFEWVTETLAVHEVWDEHISYFSKPNLTLMHKRLGFEPISCDQVRFRDTRNLVLLSRWRGVPIEASETTLTSARKTATSCRTLTAWWHAYVERLADESRQWPRPVTAIGASHIQANYIHFAGLAGIVEALIDDDPRKSGKFVLLDTPVPVITTAAALATLHGGTLLRTAFPYPGWMDKVATGLEPKGVTVVDPYRSAAAVKPKHTA